MTETAQVLFQLLTQMASEIKANIPGISGKTRESIEVRIEEDANTLKGGIWGSIAVPALETGRKPTSSGATKGTPTLQQAILGWIQSKSIQPSKGTQEGLSWAIAIKIHREGNLLFRQGGHSGVLSNVINEQRLNNFVEVFNSKASRVLLTNILKTI